ncbi:uncharacterized protein DEA37_0002946 [Paragonimus westermani]|uniref:Uncharacterized protein n=1 Tax=Paragonimus westermani TaxID=34504 RepID=A0A5J4NGG8_9TREM|nr:uncharacterized protein DEA37_0002946 [Paragonimus westermani]
MWLSSEVSLNPLPYVNLAVFLAWLTIITVSNLT